jgi:class 3 adenylate cyclase
MRFNQGIEHPYDHKSNLVKWAGGNQVTLAIIFTDIVGSTALGQQLGDELMGDARQAHFAQVRKFLDKHNGYEIKTIGDSFMATFRNVGEALNFAMDLQFTPGHDRIKIRAGIHIGQLNIVGNDAFGGTVDLVEDCQPKLTPFCIEN